MSSFLDLAKKRYSVRTYKKKEIEKDKILKILEAGRIAPTAGNMQPQRFLVLDNPSSLQKLKKAADFHDAPLAIIICGDKSSVWIRPFDKKDMIDIDAAIAADHMVLMAEDLGLGSCWLTYFKPDVIKNEFNIPENLVPVIILAIGYSSDGESIGVNHLSSRKPLEDLIKYNTY